MLSLIKSRRTAKETNSSGKSKKGSKNKLLGSVKGRQNSQQKESYPEQVEHLIQQPQTIYVSNIPIVTDSRQQQTVKDNLLSEDIVTTESLEQQFSSNMSRLENDTTRPSSRIDRPPSRSGIDRPSSRNSNSGRNKQPRLGISSSYVVYDDDSGIMSEVETSSTRFRIIAGSGTKDPRIVRPRTSPNQPPRGYSPMGFNTGGGGHHRTPNDALPLPPNSNSNLFDDDSGIMSEAETSSTKKSNRKSRNNNLYMGSLSLNRAGGKLSSVSSTLYEEDPGIMSEAETASTSSRSRKTQKYTLPVVRTPSKTLERPLGMVFLIYRGETKRAILPNEITSIITVKALFVRSFNKILTLDYLDSPRVKLYIHDSTKDTFCELVRLNEIRDRTILKVYEADSSGRGPGGLGPAGLPPITNDDEVPGEPDYVDSQQVKANKVLNKAEKEKGGTKISSTLPRNTFSGVDQSYISAASAPPSSSKTTDVTSLIVGKSKNLSQSYMRGQKLNSSHSVSGVGNRGGIESGYVSSPDGNFDFSASSALNRVVPSRFSSSSSSQGRYYPGPANTEEAKARMMDMEAQLSQLTGMVEKALKHKKLVKKQVSFDKTVTFNDDQPPSILTNSKRHQSQQQLRGGHSTSVQQQSEVHGRLKKLHRSTRELKQEVRVLKRLTQLQSMAMKDLVQDTYLKLREACISFSSQNGLMSTAENLEHLRIAQDEEFFSKELNDLFKNISDLEAKVEEVRSGVINKKNKIMLSDVEGMAISLSQCSKTVTQLRQAFPTLEANLKASQTKLEKSKDTNLMVEFLTRSSDRLDNAWKRCKKLTGTLVTLKRLASVQEQRFHPANSNSVFSMDISFSPTPSGGTNATSASQKENSLDDLLDALQTYSAQPPTTVAPVLANPPPLASTSASSTTVACNPKKEPPSPQFHLKNASTIQMAKVKPQVHLADTDVHAISKENKVPNGNVPKPPPRTVTAVKAHPPPPPPRTSSTHKTGVAENSSGNAEKAVSNAPPVAPKPDLSSKMIFKHDALETRHQELLTRQKQLQEQYQRLQEMQEKKKGSSNSKTNPGENCNNNNGDGVKAAAVVVEVGDDKRPQIVVVCADEENKDNKGQTKACETDSI